MSVLYDKIVLIGDSITELSSNLEFGFNLTPALAHHYMRKLQVVTRGFGGYNSEHGRYLFEPIIETESKGDEKVRLVVVFFGTNDCAANEQQHVSLSRYYTNMRFIADSIRNKGIPVILIGAGLCDEPNIPTKDKSIELCIDYSEAAKRAARAAEVPYLDIAREFLYSTGWKDGDPIDNFTTTTFRHLFTDDGVHYSGEGYKVLYESLLKVIRQAYPELKSEDLPQVLASIHDIDNNDLPNSLKLHP